MVYLKYYSDEHKLFPDAFGEVLDYHTTELFFNRLKAHYKFCHELVFGGGIKIAGKCSNQWIKINRNSMNLGVLVHEVAHAIQFKSGWHRKGHRFHCQKHTKIMIKVFDYVKAHRDDWIANDVVKMERAKKASQERQIKASERLVIVSSPSYKLEQLQIKEKKLLSKAKRIENCLRKVRRRIKIYEKKALVVPVPNLPG